MFSHGAEKLFSPKAHLRAKLGAHNWRQIYPDAKPLVFNQHSFWTGWQFLGVFGTASALGGQGNNPEISFLTPL